MKTIRVNATQNDSFTQMYMYVDHSNATLEFDSFCLFSNAFTVYSFDPPKKTAEFKSLVIDTKSNTKNIMKSISIHSDYQGVHFGKCLLSCLFIITEYRDVRFVTNYKTHLDVTNCLWHFFFVNN